MKTMISKDFAEGTINQFTYNDNNALDIFTSNVIFLLRSKVWGKVVKISKYKMEFEKGSIELI